MQFVRVPTLRDGAAALRDRIVHDLSDGKQVLWLLSGGSNVRLATTVMQAIEEPLSAGLTVMLMDERHGEPGHSDSNDAKLAAAGFDARQGNWIHVLQPGLGLEDTCTLFATEAAAACKQADVVIGQFGMGTDGHIAGILPGSPAVASADFATCFRWADFDRITLTPSALTAVTVAYLFAGGTDKLAQLEMLQNDTLGIDIQPAQLLKQLPEAYVCNDQIGQKLTETST